MRKILFYGDFMKKKMGDILTYDLIFVCFNILFNFILYLLNIRFRLCFIILIILISIIGFIAGIFQCLLSSKKKFGLLLNIISIIMMMTLFTSIVSSYKVEHVTTLDDKKYVVVVSSSTYVDVDYYDYYGFLLMGTKVKVHGYFGKGNFDPFDDLDSSNVVYTYYDDNGKVKDNYNMVEDFDINYIPKDEEVLYEIKFGKTILRFSKASNVLGQNMLVHVLQSKNNGKTYFVISDDNIQVSNEAKFVFLDKNIGFAINDGNIYLDGSKTGLYTTNDGGKSFTSANFKYTNVNN